MRTLLATLILLALILILCFACGLYVSNSCDQLLRFAEIADSPAALQRLIIAWQNHLSYLNLTVSRALVSKAETALSLMKGQPIGSDLFRNAQIEFIEVLMTIRSSHGLWLGSVI